MMAIEPILIHFILLFIFFVTIGDQLRTNWIKANPTVVIGTCGGDYYPYESTIESMIDGPLSGQWTFLIHTRTGYFRLVDRGDETAQVGRRAEGDESSKGGAAPTRSA